MKGQIFLAISIMIAIVLILTRLTTSLPGEKSDSMIAENFLNIKSEIKNTVEVSLLNNEPIQTNLDSFIDFSKDVMKRRGYDLSINYLTGLDTVTVDIYLENQNSFIKDQIIIDTKVYS